MHPDLLPLSFLAGSWRGTGEGRYPSVTPFTYAEHITVNALAKPVLAYVQRTSDASTGEPLHAETGYVRLPDPARPELVIAQPTGIVEVHDGTLEQVEGRHRLTFSSTAVAMTPTAASHQVTSVVRTIEVAGDALTYTVAMAAAGHPLQVHLQAALQREDG